MSAILEDIKIEKNANFSYEFIVKQSDGTPLDLSTATALSSLKKSYEATTSTLDFTTSIVSPATDGKVRLTLDSTQTATLDHNRRYVYDVILQLNGEVQRVRQGKVYVSPSVTTV